MGLFPRKSKQDRLTEDSGRFYSKDDDAAIGERARAKRASNAGGASRRPGNDPMLPEKKRARRRLVGAIALALAAAVGLPMLLDSEPKPLAGDIAIQIPAKDKAAPLPVPAADKPVSAADSVDKGEEVVEAPPPAPASKAPAAVAAVTAPQPAPKVEHKPESKPEPAKPEPVKSEPARPEHKDVPKPEHKEPRPEPRLAEKEKPVKPKTDDKPVRPHDDAARAMAILEGKQAEKAAEKDKPAESGSQKFVLQVAALSSPEKAAEVQARLREAGISSYTQKTNTPAGELIRVRVGPLNKDDAEKVRAKLGRLGMAGTMSPV
ncbi:SPOR domain-containing protein [Massilia luteola]|uniref:SPOR domain-containing protein n=1 Tax=Massilia luteola TaxID=3081751 RepID=UPI002ACBF874|nr:SPOR domain-containing protein [Massilia sp. Gc5]